MKLPAHRAGLPGNEISFLIVPLDPAYKAGLAGHLPVRRKCSPLLLEVNGVLKRGTEDRRSRPKFPRYLGHGDPR